MARMIDLRPSLHGEAKVWDAVKAYLPDNVIAYNNREINGREFDFCLFLEDVGIAVIEVKGWITNKIEVNGIDNIRIEGYDLPQRSPKKQARAYRFALLNKIVEKHNTSPLVFDMVCYPFISKADYLVSHLDIVSEEQFTIFKEDLENADLLIGKINSAFRASSSIPHSSFSHELVMKLRQDWEPNIFEYTAPTEFVAMPYSKLSIYPDELSQSEINTIIKEYFNGIKSVLFLGQESSFSNIVSTLDVELKNHNVQPHGNALRFGYKDGIHAGSNSIRLFNFEAYLVDNLSELTPSAVLVEEGHMSDETASLLEKLATTTPFNIQQYYVEHSPASGNTLVQAGAGTGKTFSMVSRVAFLCCRKNDAISNIAEDIVMVTFTNDAASNMKVRLKQMFVNYYVLTNKPRFLKFVEDTDRAHISTIHSFALSILRDEPLYTGLGTRFRISSNEYLRGQLYDNYLNSFLGEKESENPNFINEIPVPIYDLKKKIVMVADRLLAKSVDLRQIKPSEMGVTVNNTIIC